MEFVSQKKRFWPHLPDEEEVKLLIDAYENLIMVIRAVRDKKIDLDLEQGECIYRVYDKETGKWNMFVDAQPDMEKQFPAVQLNEEDLKKQLQEKPQTDAELIMDFSYAGFPAQDEAYDQPVHPLMFIAVDSTRKEVLEAYFLSPDDGEIEAALNFFIAYVERHGRMKRIKARNPWILERLLTPVRSVRWNWFMIRFRKRMRLNRILRDARSLRQHRENKRRNMIKTRQGRRTCRVF